MRNCFAPVPVVQCQKKNANGSGQRKQQAAKTGSHFGAQHPTFPISPPPPMPSFPRNNFRPPVNPRIQNPYFNPQRPYGNFPMPMPRRQQVPVQPRPGLQARSNNYYDFLRLPVQSSQSGHNRNIPPQRQHVPGYRQSYSPQLRQRFDFGYPPYPAYPSYGGGFGGGINTVSGINTINGGFGGGGFLGSYLNPANYHGRIDNSRVIVSLGGRFPAEMLGGITIFLGTNVLILFGILN